MKFFKTLFLALIILMPSAGFSSMALITAIIKPFKLKDVQRSLAEINIPTITVSEVKGSRSHKQGHTELYRGEKYNVDFLPKTKIQVVVNSSQVDEAMNAIEAAAATDRHGDGIIFTTHIDNFKPIGLRAHAVEIPLD